MSAIIAQIRTLVEQIVEHTDVFIVDISLRGERSSKVVEVYIDTDTGISLDQCSQVSRELSAKLDETEIIAGRYRLDVSSPGLERPLKLLRQYARNVGRTCRVVTRHQNSGESTEGILERVDEKSIHILKKGKTAEIPFAEILETFIIPQIK